MYIYSQQYKIHKEKKQCFFFLYFFSLSQESFYINLQKANFSVVPGSQLMTWLLAGFGMDGKCPEADGNPGTAHQPHIGPQCCLAFFLLFSSQLALSFSTVTIL